MPRKCTICEHPQASKINEMLIKGATYREITGKFGVTRQALSRHKKHLPSELIRAGEAEKVAKADDLLRQITDLRDRALRILEKAEQAGKLKTALDGVKEARGCLELLAKLQGELQEQTTINILVNPQWVYLRTVILEALEPYPEARLAVAQVLQEVGDDVR